MLKVTGAAMPAALTSIPVTVYAAAGDGEKEASAPLNRDDLSLYTAPPLLQSRYVEPGAGQLEQSVASLRTSVQPVTTWCQSTYSNIKPKVQEVIRFGNDTYDYLKNPPKDVYPRAGVIAFTGVLGLFLSRGSRIKKLIYPAGLMTVSASLYYPEQAVAIAKSTGDSVYDSAVQSFAAVEKMLKLQNKKEKDSETKP